MTGIISQYLKTDDHIKIVKEIYPPNLPVLPFRVYTTQNTSVESELVEWEDVEMEAQCFACYSLIYLIKKLYYKAICNGKSHEQRIEVCNLTIAYLSLEPTTISKKFRMTLHCFHHYKLNGPAVLCLTFALPLL